MSQLTLQRLLKSAISCVFLPVALLSTFTARAYANTGSTGNTVGTASDANSTGSGQVTTTTSDNVASSNTLVALGDSITFGYNLGDNQSPSLEAFPYWIGKQLQYSVNDLGVPGATSEDLLTSVSLASVKSAVTGAKLITVDIGSNDLLQVAMPLLLQAAAGKSVSVTTQETSQFEAAIQNFKTTMPAILQKLSQDTSAPVLVYDLYDPVPSTLSLHTLAEKYISEENQIIQQAVQNQNGDNPTGQFIFVDDYSVFSGHQSQYILPLDVHPTVAGQEALAQVGEGALTAYETAKSTGGSSSSGPGQSSGGSAGTGAVDSSPSTSKSSGSGSSVTSKKSGGDGSSTSNTSGGSIGGRTRFLVSRS